MSWTTGFKRDRYKYNFNSQQTRHIKDKLPNSEIELGISDVNEARINECSYAYANYEECLMDTDFNFEVCMPFQKHMSKCEHARGIYNRQL
jgi:hypothetical protein